MLKHYDAGIVAERVPLCGPAGGSFSSDLLIHPEWRDAPLVAEVKARVNAEGFATRERCLDDNDILFLWREQAEPLAAVRLELWLSAISNR
ncbi:MAG: hypothetical protein AAF698_01240 [Pseudomonadota bacterium]